jgi:hypothetical protein
MYFPTMETSSIITRLEWGWGPCPPITHLSIVRVHMDFLTDIVGVITYGLKINFLSHYMVL